MKVIVAEGERIGNEGRNQTSKRWATARLGDVVEFLDYRRRPVNEAERRQRIAGKKQSELFPYYGANGQVGWIDDFIFDEPLILLAEDGGNFGSRTKPVAYAVSGRYWVNNHAHCLRPKEGLDFDFLRHALSIRPDIGELVSGSTRGKLNQEVAAHVEVPLPSLAEQQRIALRLTQQLGWVERGRAAAQSRLAAAELLPAAHVRQVFERQDWPSLELGEGMIRFEAGTSVLARGRPAESGEWGVLKVSAVSWGQFKSHENKAVLHGYVPPERERVQSGDLIISRANTAELAGAIVLVRETPTNLMLSDKTLRLVLKPGVFAPEFLEYALRSREARTFIESNATGTSYSMRNISQPTIRAIPVPTPPLADQYRIAADLSQRLAAADRLAEQLRDELAAIESLPAALLRAAIGNANGT